MRTEKNINIEEKKREEERQEYTNMYTSVGIGHKVDAMLKLPIIGIKARLSHE